MITKRRIAIAAIMVLVLSILTAGTLAFFTAEEKAHNVITSGKVDIELHEWADEAKETPFPEEGVSGVLPGKDVIKIAEIENTGSADCWVRVSVTKAIELAEGKEGEVDLDLVILDIDTENWTEKDGWYYYNEAVKPGETTKPLFTKATFAPSMNNLYQGSTATVDLIGQAVQTANNGSSALEATGWPNA